MPNFPDNPPAFDRRSVSRGTLSGISVVQQSACNHPPAARLKRRARKRLCVACPSAVVLFFLRPGRRWSWAIYLPGLLLAFHLSSLLSLGDTASLDERLLPPWPDESPAVEGPQLTLPEIETPTTTSWVWISGQNVGADESSRGTVEGFLGIKEPVIQPPGESAADNLLIPEDQVFAPDAVPHQGFTAAGVTRPPCCPDSPLARRPHRGIARGLVTDLQNAGQWQRWQSEPGSAGVFLGYGWGSELVNNWLEERDGVWGGVRLGWDCSEQYGVETRLSFGTLDLWDHPDAVAAGSELGMSGPRDRWVRAVEWDAVLLYYPTENDPWRPYVFWGVVLTRIDFADFLGTSYEGTYFAMPIGLGLKFRPKSGPVMRFEFVDQIVFPSRFNTTHHFAFTVGLEMRFGARRKIYWPWESPRW